MVLTLPLGVKTAANQKKNCVQLSIPAVPGRSPYDSGAGHL
jgi:hypothetical protein